MDLPCWFMMRKVLFTDFGIDNFIHINNKQRGGKGCILIPDFGTSYRFYEPSEKTKN